jgi:hypothetical protein
MQGEMGYVARGDVKYVQHLVENLKKRAHL